MICPKCKQDRAHRSHRTNFKERIASLAGYYPYRCRECAARFLVFRYADTGSESGKPVAEIAQTRRRIRWRNKRRELVLYSGAALGLTAFLYYIARERD